MAGTALSECVKAFINHLTARTRQQIKSLISSLKLLAEIQLGLLRAQIAQYDLLKNAINLNINGLESLLLPIEAQYNQLFKDYKDLQKCIPLNDLAKGIQDTYFKYKNITYNGAFKVAQVTSLSALLEDKIKYLENTVTMLDNIANYIDAMATFRLEDGDIVNVYTTNKDPKTGKEYSITKLDGTITGTEINSGYKYVSFSDGTSGLFSPAEIEAKP